MRMRCASKVLHDPFGEKEVSKEVSDKEIRSIQSIKDVFRECRPSDRVRDGNENPVKLSERSLSVLQVAGDACNHAGGDMGRLLANDMVT